MEGWTLVADSWSKTVLQRFCNTPMQGLARLIRWSQRLVSTLVWKDTQRIRAIQKREYLVHLLHPLFSYSFTVLFCLTYSITARLSNNMHAHTHTHTHTHKCTRTYIHTCTRTYAPVFRALRPLLDNPQRLAAEEIQVSVHLGCEIKQIIARYTTRALVMANSPVCWQAPSVITCKF